MTLPVIIMAHAHSVQMVTVRTPSYHLNVPALKISMDYFVPMRNTLAFNSFKFSDKSLQAF